MISIADREQLLTKCVANPLKGFVCYDNMWEHYANHIFEYSFSWWLFVEARDYVLRGQYGFHHAHDDGDDLNRQVYLLRHRPVSLSPLADHR